MEQLVPAARRKDFEFGAKKQTKEKERERAHCLPVSRDRGTRGEETAPVSRDSDLHSLPNNPNSCVKLLRGLRTR